MDKSALTEILNKIKRVRVCVIGDVCLDIYWHADMRRSRLSRETPHFPLPVTEERFSLGGGGNVMANVCALGVQQMIPVSVLGRDWRAVPVKDCFQKFRCPRDYLIEDRARVTPCYAKPLRQGISDVVYEDPRLDFENLFPLSAETERKVLSALLKAAKEADVIAVSDQLENGVITPAVREAICELGDQLPVIVDSRDRIAQYCHVIAKPNQVEVFASCASAKKAATPEDAARALARHTLGPVVVTLGEQGSLLCEHRHITRIPAVPVSGPVDAVGAGDTFLAAFAAAVGARIPGPDALQFASLASAVTVQKIGTTGVASPEEILGISN